MKKHHLVSAVAVLSAGLVSASVIPATALTTVGSAAPTAAVSAPSTAPGTTYLGKVDGAGSTSTDQGLRSFSSVTASPVASVYTSHTGVLTVTDADGQRLCETLVTSPGIHSCVLADIRPGSRELTIDVARTDGQDAEDVVVRLDAYAQAPTLESAIASDGLTTVTGSTYPDSRVVVSEALGRPGNGATADVRSDSEGRFTAVLNGEAPGGVGARVERQGPAVWGQGGDFGWSLVAGNAFPVTTAPGDATAPADGGAPAEGTGPADGGTPAEGTGPADGGDAGTAPVLLGASWDQRGEVVTARFTGTPNTEVEYSLGDRVDSLQFDERGRGFLQERLSARFRWQLDMAGLAGGSVVLGEASAPLVTPGGRAVTAVRPSILPFRDVYVAGLDGAVSIVNDRGELVQRGIVYGNGLQRIRLVDVPAGPLVIRFDDGSSLDLADDSVPVAPGTGDGDDGSEVDPGDQTDPGSEVDPGDQTDPGSEVDPGAEASVTVTGATWDAKGEKATLALSGQPGDRATVHVGNDDYTAVFGPSGTDSLTVSANERFRWAVSVDGHPEADTTVGKAGAPLVERGGIAATQVTKTLTRDIYVAGRDDLARILDADGKQLASGIVYSNGNRAVTLWNAPAGPLTAYFNDGTSTTIR